MPRSVNDMKLIHAGKILENGKTLAESRVHIGDLPGGVITMHVVVQPAVVKKKTGLFIFLFSIASIFWFHFALSMWFGYNQLKH